ncbi:kinetochore-associated Ndc80 complex subunit ndc80 [Globodera pallida]|nr:kinetochore-associated Ndc80 complex subunit ndc80 [Globodera pallida]
MNPERKSLYGRKSILPHNQRTPSAAPNRNLHGPNSGLRTGRLADEARASMAAGFSMCSRPSGIPGCKGRRIPNVPKKQNTIDPRNLRDREVQAGIIRKVVQFLADRMDPAPPFSFDEPNFLRYPSKNDFKNVFQYFFQCIEPTFQVQKIEQDALNLLNQYGYPYALKQSTMQTMTLPTSWGQLLGALDWMIDIVEMENDMYQSVNKVRDDPQCNLLAACFKKLMAKGHGQPYDVDVFKDEFDDYRRQRMTEKGIDFNSHDELVGRRVAQEQKIHKLEEAIAQANCVAEGLEQKIADFEKDMLTLDKYLEDLSLMATQKEQTLKELISASKELDKQRVVLAKENAEKERQIGAQKLSGQQARELISKRQSVREELLMLRENLNKTEMRIYELQPTFFKQSAKIRSDYNGFISCLRVLCESLFDSEELQQQNLAELEQCSFDQAIVEFQRSRDDNKLKQLLTNLQGLAESQISSVKQSEEAVRLTKSKLVNEINEMESIKGQLQTKQKLDLERAKRGLEDKHRGLVDLMHNLDIVKQKHQATANELSKYEKQRAKLHDELAEKHKNYLDYKQRLDAQYNELQSQVLEKVTKLCERFQQIQEQKKRYKELGEEMIDKNTTTLKELQNKKNPKSE